MTSSSRTEIIGILVLAGRKLTAAQLIRLAEPVRLSATNIKSHLTRMVAEGTLRREGRVRLATYEPSAQQALVVRGIEARLRATDDPWDGSWLMLSIETPKNRGDRELLRASLWFDGWRPLRPGVHIRPAWPPAWAEASAQSHAGHALGICLSGRLVAAPMDPGKLYEIDKLDSQARRLAAWLDRRGCGAVTPRAAFRDRLSAGGRVARFIGHDPRLPPAVWGRKLGMRELQSAFQRFEGRIAASAGEFVESILKAP